MLLDGIIKRFCFSIRQSWKQFMSLVFSPQRREWWWISFDLNSAPKWFGDKTRQMRSLLSISYLLAQHPPHLYYKDATIVKVNEKPISGPRLEHNTLRVTNGSQRDIETRDVAEIVSIGPSNFMSCAINISCAEESQNSSHYTSERCAAPKLLLWYWFVLHV